MRWRPILFMPLLLLSACVSTSVNHQPAPGAQTGATGAPARCRVGPDGGPPRADRGIGGTGGPTLRRADRGIGGTGGPTPRSSDRGIGGTGITGVVLGFASVCVDDQEVALDDRTTIDIDGAPDDVDTLRVGQIVAIRAGPPAEAPKASAVSVRHEVSGPVEAVLTVTPGLIVVAGQRVRVPKNAMGSLVIKPGVWVAVSGLRGPDGDIIASRLDPRPAGRVLVHGPLFAVDGETAIGSMAIRIGEGAVAQTGTYVVAAGTYENGTLAADTVLPDLLLNDPPAYFGHGATRLTLETYSRFTSGSATIAGGFQARLVPGVGPPRGLTGPAVISLEAQPDGSFAIVSARVASVPASVPNVLAPGGSGLGPGAGASPGGPGVGPSPGGPGGPGPPGEGPAPPGSGPGPGGGPYLNGAPASQPVIEAAPSMTPPSALQPPGGPVPGNASPAITGSNLPPAVPAGGAVSPGLSFGGGTGFVAGGGGRPPPAMTMPRMMTPHPNAMRLRPGH